MWKIITAFKKFLRNKNKQFMLDFLIKCNKKIVSMLVFLSPVLATKYLYMLTMGKKLNLKNPQDFNEKLQWLKLYWQHPLIIKCADKYMVRQYVEECGYGDILNELYGGYDDVSEINWEKLPEKFALKTNNASGTNIINDGKNKLSKENVLKKLKKWLRSDYGRYFAEPHYSKIKPKIIIEKYLGSEDGVWPFDYRFYCFNGEPRIILLSLDRATELKCIFYDIDWNRIIIEDMHNKKFHHNKIVRKPECLNEMVECAKKLSEPFPFVRVDFYNYANKIIFGEMTFTPSGCMLDYHNQESLKTMGDWIKLPRKYIENKE